MTPIFKLIRPTVFPLPVLANLPHSGLFVPEAIRGQLTAAHQTFLPHQDWHLDQLYNFLPALGITMLQATHSRYVVDLNRSLKPPYFGNFWSSAIAEKTAFDVPLYQTKPSAQDIEQRLEDYYRPYHAELKSQLNQLIEQFGQVYLLDLHSFYGPITDDICLGNANGKTCSDFFIDTVDNAFAQVDFGVVRNKVFNGGYITQHYGGLPKHEALQVEVRYPVYLDESQLAESRVPDWQVPHFDQAKLRFKTVFAQIAETFSES
ncbi:N-formylglutamate amidohydrolase [Nodosilinea nodulosa]|uniref:N-formylglutamate amidohydrolase n=1 Tax=Nodosilinea nodulosa TaxID=416001 RepID=UPI000474F1BF|nr:N-formylglutamate amidohydrolase [Nodosilinea nodulosa]